MLRRVVSCFLTGLLAFSAVAPVGAQVSPAPIEAKIETGEIRLEGVVQSYDATKRQLVLQVKAFTLANGRSTKLAAPKAKTVWLNDKVVVRDGDIALLRIGATISVIGKDTGSGADIRVRLLEHLNSSPPEGISVKTIQPAEIAADFSESEIELWSAFTSDGTTASVAPEGSRFLFGSQSIKFTSACGFDTGVSLSPGANARWDLSRKKYLTFWAYAENEHAFQDRQPIIVLKSPSGSYRYEPRGIGVRDGQWRQFQIPLAGDAQWVRTQAGLPELQYITALEIHQDTFDFGFTLYYDGITFVDSVPNVKAMPRGVDPFVIEPKVFLIVIDPILKGGNGARVRDVYGWSNPFDLVPQVIADLNRSSHGRVNYKVVTTQIVDDFPYEADGKKYTERNYHRAYAKRKKQFHEVDLKRFITDYKIVPHIENGDIDEVWLYTPPFGTPESVMAGKGDAAYWVNWNPLDMETKRSFIMMGLNFERGVAEAIHSFGHRSESIMKEMYGGWSPQGQTAWDKFTRLNKDAPDEGGVGTVHFPVNGTSDYDYHNPQTVMSNADDWINYPNLKGTSREVSPVDWGTSVTEDDPNLAVGQREYLNWWYAHIPHFSGRAPDGRLNNWWRYLTDVDTFRRENTIRPFESEVPAIAINNLMQNQEVSGVVNVRADAASDALLGRVDFFVDGVLVGNDTLAPYTFDWDTAALAGDHVLSAKAYGLTTVYEAAAPPVRVTIK